MKRGSSTTIRSPTTILSSVSGLRQPSEPRAFSRPALGARLAHRSTARGAVSSRSAKVSSSPAAGMAKDVLQMASESDKRRLYPMIKQLANAKQLIFIGVIDPIHPTVETAAQVRDRILEAASFLPVEQLGTTDDCGFAPFADDISTARDTAFKKIQARVEGTELASRELGA